jgi:hypothetical protein
VLHGRVLLDVLEEGGAQRGEIRYPVAQGAQRVAVRQVDLVVAGQLAAELPPHQPQRPRAQVLQAFGRVEIKQHLRMPVLHRGSSVEDLDPGHLADDRGR